MSNTTDALSQALLHVPNMGIHGGIIMGIHGGISSGMGMGPIGGHCDAIAPDAGALLGWGPQLASPEGLTDTGLAAGAAILTEVGCNRSCLHVAEGAA